MLGLSGCWAAGYCTVQIALIQQIFERQIDVEVAVLKSMEEMVQLQVEAKQPRKKLFGIL